MIVAVVMVPFHGNRHLKTVAKKSLGKKGISVQEPKCRNLEAVTETETMEEWFLLTISAWCSSTQDHTQWAALPSIINQEMPPTDLPIIWVEAFLNWGSSSQINRAYLSWQNVIKDTASWLPTQTANRFQFPQLHKNLELTVLPRQPLLPQHWGLQVCSTTSGSSPSYPTFSR